MRFTVLLCFWKTILERFNKNQVKLQRSDITLSSTCEVYSSLKEHIMSKRGTFEAFEKEAIILCGNERHLVSRNKKKKHPADGSTTKITQESCCENIRRTFIEIINNIILPLESKINAYVRISTKKFYFFSNLKNPNQLRNKGCT